MWKCENQQPLISFQGKQSLRSPTLKRTLTAAEVHVYELTPICWSGLERLVRKSSGDVPVCVHGHEPNTTEFMETSNHFL